MPQCIIYIQILTFFWKADFFLKKDHAKIKAVSRDFLSLSQKKSIAEEAEGTKKLWGQTKLKKQQEDKKLNSSLKLSVIWFIVKNFNSDSVDSKLPAMAE